MDKQRTKKSLQLPHRKPSSKETTSQTETEKMGLAQNQANEMNSLMVMFQVLKTHNNMLNLLPCYFIAHPFIQQELVLEKQRKSDYRDQWACISLSSASKCTPVLQVS